MAIREVVILSAVRTPIGASGARILTTLINALKSLNKRRGVASLCIGGGEAVAMMVERIGTYF
jgi:acetyl-CoA C-acetyltransferase